MKKRHLIYPLLFIAASINSCISKEKGCTDPTADNFSLHADEDDGSCTYSKFLEGNFVFSGNRSGGGGSSIAVQDTFFVTDLGGENYLLTGLADCNEIRVVTMSNTWKLQSSDCDIQSWNFNFSGGNFMFVSFSAGIGSSRFNYSGQASKL